MAGRYESKPRQVKEVTHRLHPSVLCKKDLGMQDTSVPGHVMQRTTHIQVAISHLATYFRSQDELQGLGIKEIHVLGQNYSSVSRGER